MWLVTGPCLSFSSTQVSSGNWNRDNITTSVTRDIIHRDTRQRDVTSRININHLAFSPSLLGKLIWQGPESVQRVGGPGRGNDFVLESRLIYWTEVNILPRAEPAQPDWGNPGELCLWHTFCQTQILIAFWNSSTWWVYRYSKLQRPL